MLLKHSRHDPVFSCSLCLTSICGSLLELCPELRTAAVLQMEAARSCQEDDGPRQPPIEQVVIVEHPDGCQSVTIVRQELKPDATADGLLTELPPEGMLKPPS